VSDVALDMAAEFVQMTDELDELKRQQEVIEGQIKELKARMQPVEKQLLETFAEAGVNNISIHGKLLYIHRQIWARPREGNYERACEVLKEIGLEQFVKETVNINTISAYVREQDELGGELPKRFDEAFKVDEDYQVRARKR
jgi:prefoldin subunit 5